MKTPELKTQQKEKWVRLSAPILKAVYDVLERLGGYGTLPEGKPDEDSSAEDFMNYAERVLEDKQFWADLPDTRFKAALAELIEEAKGLETPQKRLERKVAKPTEKAIEEAMDSAHSEDEVRQKTNEVLREVKATLPRGYHFSIEKVVYKTHEMEINKKTVTIRDIYVKVAVYDDDSNRVYINARFGDKYGE